MKQIIISLVIVLLFLLGNTFANEKNQPGTIQRALDENSNSPMGSGIIKGQVKWASDGTPVAWAVVELHFPPDGRGPRIKYVADSTGNYYVDGLEPGKYHVYLPGAVTHGDKATFIFVNEGQFYLQINNNTTTEVNFQVKEGCAISGKITHQNTGLLRKNYSSKYRATD